MSLYDFYHTDTGCQQFALGYVFKNLKLLGPIYIKLYYSFQRMVMLNLCRIKDIAVVFPVNNAIDQ